MRYRLKSIDVWDTILRRRSHPEGVKLQVSQYLSMKHGRRLARSFSDRDSIYRERWRVELEIRSGRQRSGLDNECSLREVFEALVERIFERPPSAGEQRDLVDDLLAREVEFERRNTYVDPGVRSCLELYPSEKTIFLSDFYMPAEMLREILEHHGVQEFVPDGGFSSCDFMLTKASGRLFRHVHELFGVRPNEHLHIGDDKHVDVAVPRSMGCAAVHYKPPVEHSKRLGRERHGLDRSRLFEEVAREVAGVAAVESARSTNPAAFCLGSDLAPLFVGYALFTAEQAIERGLEQLLFMTREGEFFVETFDLLFAHGEANGHVLPQWKVLAVSRMSTFAASLAEISFAEMMRLWSCFSIQTMTAFGSSLGVDIPMEWLARHALDGDEPLSKPWRDRRVSSLFGDPDFVSLVQERAHAARRGFLSYAARELSDGRRPIGLVDIGWRGTIQDNIASILPDREFHGIYLALEEFLNPQPPNTHKIAYGPDRNRGDDASLLEPFLLLEMLCNSPNGSVTGYETMRNGVIRAVRVVSEKENRTFLDFTQHLQEGVYCAARVWKPYVERYAITSGDLRKAALHIWRGLVETPPADVINAHVTLDHNAMFWTGGFTRAVVPSYRTLLFAPLSKKHRLDLVIFFVHSQNLTYVSMRNDLDFIEKLVWGSVVGAIRALRGLKRRLAVVRRTTIRN